MGDGQTAVTENQEIRRRDGKRRDVVAPKKKKTPGGYQRPSRFFFGATRASFVARASRGKQAF